MTIRPKRSLFTIFCVVLSASALFAETVQPATQAKTAANDSAGAPANTADELAEKVLQHAGGRDGWAKVKNLRFTFAGRQTVLWDVVGGKVRVENLVQPKPGERATPWTVAVYDIAADRDLIVGGKSVEGMPGVSAKGTWTNHTYWLLVTTKVMDPGVKRAIDPRQEGDAEGVQRLRLSFESVGMTPENEYVLHVESATGKVMRWDYYRKVGEEPKSWHFENYTQVGPLMLSLSRPMIDGDMGIELTDVSVNVNVPADAWTSRELILPAPTTDGNAEGDTAQKEGPVEVVGTLTHGVVAIGAETTGTTITTRAFTWELDLSADPQLSEIAAAYTGKEVRVEGNLERITGVEIPERWIVRVTVLDPDTAHFRR